jgi:translation initiation factor 1 (eIF-1/SUI1)
VKGKGVSFIENDHMAHFDAEALARALEELGAGTEVAHG